MAKRKKSEVQTGEEQKKLSIDAILKQTKRRTWLSGDSLGRLLIANMARWNKMISEGETPAILLTQEKWQQYVSILRSGYPEHMMIYNRYLAITYWLQQFCTDVLGSIKSFSSDIEAKRTAVLTAQMSEEAMIAYNHAVDSLSEYENYDSEVFSSVSSLYNLMTLKKYADNPDLMEEEIKRTSAILRNYKRILAFNQCLDIIIEVTEVPDMDFYKIDTEPLKEDVETLNDAIDSFKKTARKLYRLKSNKRRVMLFDVLDKAFMPIDLKTVQLNSILVLQAYALAADDLKAFSSQDQYAAFYEDILGE